MRQFLVHAQPHDPATGERVDVRLSLALPTAAGSLVDGVAYTPALTELPTQSINWWSNGRVDEAATQHGNIGFRLNRELANEAWGSWDWDGAPTTISTGQLGAPLSAMTAIFTGKSGPIEREGQDAKVALRGPEADLTARLLREYAGTGGAEGPVDIEGALKPQVFGRVLNISPRLIDAARQVYQVHDGAVSSILAVYENALEVGAAPTATATTYLELSALTLLPGEFAIAPAVGMFRLGGQPRGKLSADVEGDAAAGSTIGSIVSALLARAGVPASKIDPAIATDWTQSWSYFADGQTDIGAIARLAFAGMGFLFADGAGVWRASDAYGSSGAPIALKTDRSARPLVRSIKQRAAMPPVNAVKVGHTRCWTVHSESEISEALIVAGQSAQAAQAAADTAQAAADIANARLASIADDATLDRSDKFVVISEHGRLITEQAPNDARADVFGIDRTAYDDSITALTTYLDALSPSWLNTGVDTPIDPATFRSKFASVYAQRTALLNAFTAAASKRAEWDQVSGEGKPQDNATVGAPDGTQVAGKPAIEVVSDLDAALTKGTAAVAALTDANGTLRTVVEIQQTVADARAQAAAELASARQSLDTDIGTARNEAATIRADLSDEVTRARSAEDTITNTVESLSLATDGNTVRIDDEIIARTDGDSALASRAAALESRATTGENDRTALTARIANEETTRASETGALTNRATAAESEYRSQDAARIAQADQDRTDRQQGDAALNDRVVDTNARLTDEATTRAAETGALTNRVAAAESEFRTQDSAITARLAAEETTRSSETGALSSRISNAETEYRANNTTTNARINTTDATLSNLNNAVATRTTEVDARFAGQAVVTGLTPNGTFSAGEYGWKSYGGGVYLNRHRDPVYGDYWASVAGTHGIWGGEELVPVRAGQKIRLHARIVVHNSTQTNLVGLNFYNNEGVEFSNLFTDRSFAPFLGSQFYTIDQTFDSANFPAGTVAIRPIVHLNYPSSSAGETWVLEMWLEDVTAEVATNARLTDETTTRAAETGALSSRISNAETEYRANNTTTNARINTTDATLSNLNNAVATRNTLVDARFKAQAVVTGLTPNGTFSAGASGWKSFGGGVYHAHHADPVYGDYWASVAGTYGIWGGEELVPVRAGQKIRLHARIVVHNSTQTNLVGLNFYNNEGVEFSNLFVDRSFSPFPGGQFYTLDQTFDSADFPAGTVAVRPIVHLNYPTSTAGETWVLDMWLEDVTVEVATAARITSEETTRASADSALATRTSTLEANSGTLSAKVSTSETAITDLRGRTAAYWQTEAVAGNNRAQLRIRADANSGAGVDIVGDVAISGDLLVGGSIGSAKFAASSVQQIVSQVLTYAITIPHDTSAPPPSGGTTTTTNTGGSSGGDRNIGQATIPQ